MTDFRKKPVVIQAERALEQVSIVTLEGTMVAEPGDWIITGVKGERYPCKDDIFRATYEAVDNEGRAALAPDAPGDAEVCPICGSDHSGQFCPHNPPPFAPGG